MFVEFRGKIGATRTELDARSDVIDKVGVISGNSPRQIEAINGATSGCGLECKLLPCFEACGRRGGRGSMDGLLT